jgi:hypothetical protein
MAKAESASRGGRGYGRNVEFLNLRRWKAASAVRYGVTFLLALLAAILLIRWLKIKTAATVQIGDVSVMPSGSRFEELSGTMEWQELNERSRL